MRGRAGGGGGGKIKRNRLRGEYVRMDVVSTYTYYTYPPSVWPVSIWLSVYPSSV